MAFSVTADVPFLFSRTFKSITTYSNPLTLANETLIPGSLNFDHEGCLYTGLEPVNENIRLAIFPTPASDKIFIRLPGQVLSVRIFDKVGRTLIFRGRSNEELLELDCSSFLSGIYHAECQLSDGRKLSGQFIIQ